MIKPITMEMKKERGNEKNQIILIVVLGLIILSAGVFWQLDRNSLKAKLATLETADNVLAGDLANAHASLTKITGVLDAKLVKLTKALFDSETDREDLESNLRLEKLRNNEFEDQIDNIADTITVLDKLSKTDEELLQKYSKVYFLNEHFVPERLLNIDDKWKYNEERKHKLHDKVMPFFEDMMEEALKADIEIKVVSAYRSFSEQKQLKGDHLVIYGQGANTFSADQGYSEHQLGTTIDLTTDDVGDALDGFEKAKAYRWLKKHAYKYGFVLSYPPDNQYYVFEPWHWRFVGTKLARALDRDDAYFYDWEQRKIDEYLVSIFD